MPFKLEVSATEGLVRATATGRIGVDDVRDHMARVRRVGAARFPELIDATRAESLGFTLRDLLTMAQFAHSQFGAESMGPRAVLVASKRHFEWARVFGALVAGWMTVGVFTDRREAMLWLEHRTRGSASEEPSQRRAAIG